jgi:hypothetical protein
LHASIIFLIGLANLKIGLASSADPDYILGQQCPQYILVMAASRPPSRLTSRDQ